MAWRKLLPVAVLLALAPAVGEVRAEKLTYDPDSCAVDAEGMVYIALDRAVLRFPARELTYIGDWPSDKNAPVYVAPRPPKPSEPEGCPGNPIQASSFNFAYRYQAIKDDRRDPRIPMGVPDFLRLIAARPDFYGMQKFHEAQFERRCDVAEPENLPNGLVACLVQPADKTSPKAGWSGSYRAQPEIYRTPLGRPFVAACLSGVAKGTRQCSVSYKFEETINVAYRFSTLRISISDVIALDQDLRAKIAAARVEDYPWPETDSYGFSLGAD